MKLQATLVWLLLVVMNGSISAQEAPKLLIKMTTSGHPEQFFKTLDAYYQNLSQEIPYHFIVTCDASDATMNSTETKNRLEKYPHLTTTFIDSTSKPVVYNHGLNERLEQFDLILVVSDAVEPMTTHYDKVIVEAMQKHFVDYDGVLNFQIAGDFTVNKAPVIGKKYYQRFGYIYQPAYKSAFYDNELTAVSRILAKEAIIQQAILKPTAAPLINYPTNQKSDEELFQKRRLDTFTISEATLRSIFKKEWSILVCTLDERVEEFTKIYNKLTKQIRENHLEDQIEIVVHRDNRELTIGAKRNVLLEKSRGMYTCYVDDDDDVHDNYIKMIYSALKKSSPDCVGLLGVITFNGQSPTLFYHSVQYDSFFQAHGIFFRPPNHWNTMKRSTACQFLFPNISVGEDTDWAMQIVRSGLLKREESILVPYYFYSYIIKSHYYGVLPNWTNSRSNKRSESGLISCRL